MDKKTQENDSIKDFIMLVKIILSNRWQVVRTVAIFTTLGILIAVFSTKKYKATTSFIPISDKTSSVKGLGGLASLAGIDIESGNSYADIPPSLYNILVESVPFKRKMVEKPLVIMSEGRTDTISYKRYYTEVYEASMLNTVKKYTLGLPKLIINYFRVQHETESNSLDFGDRILAITGVENFLFGQLTNEMKVDFDVTEGLVTISFIMENPGYAAQMASHAERLLQEELIGYKVQRAKEHLNYTQLLYEEKKKDFENDQKALANFQDSNLVLSTTTARNQLQRLLAEFDLSSSIYSELATQLEQAKLQVNKDTPVFYVIKPVVVPYGSFSPNRLLIIVVLVILGFLIAMGMIFGRHLISQIQKQW